MGQSFHPGVKGGSLEFLLLALFIVNIAARVGLCREGLLSDRNLLF